MKKQRSSRLLIDEQPLQLLPSLAVRVGLKEAIFIQQLHFWSTLTNIGVWKDGRKWVRNNLDEWHANFPFWSKPTLRRTIKSARDQWFVDARDDLNFDKEDRTLWYAINHKKLDEAFDQNDQLGEGANDQNDQLAPKPYDQNDQLYYKTKNTKTENTLSAEALEFIELWNSAIVDGSPYALDAEGKKRKSKIADRPTNKSRAIEKSVATRLKNKSWRENWKRAIQKAAQNLHLMTSAWFVPEYFLRNDEKINDILSGVFDDFHSQKLRKLRFDQMKQGRDEKNQLFMRFSDLIKTKGRTGFKAAQAEIGGWNLAAIARDVAGGWANCCDMKPDDLRIKFYGVVKQDGKIESWRTA